jgi:hypothetical protein
MSTIVQPGSTGWFEIYHTCTPTPCTITVTFPSGSTVAASGPTQASDGWKWTFRVPGDPGSGTAGLELKCTGPGGLVDQTYPIEIQLPSVGPTACSGCFSISAWDAFVVASGDTLVLINLEAGEKGASCEVEVTGPVWTRSGTAAQGPTSQIYF